MRSVDQIFDDFSRREEASRVARREEFFSEGDQIPDLDLMPSCSVCGGSLEYDEAFYCDGCNIEWNRGGTNGERIPD